MMSNLITPHHFALEETDLQVRGGGGERRPDPETRGGGRSPKNFFSAQFGLKIRGGELPPPLWCSITLLQSILK